MLFFGDFSFEEVIFIIFRFLDVFCGFKFLVIRYEGFFVLFYIRLFFRFWYGVCTCFVIFVVCDLWFTEFRLFVIVVDCGWFCFFVYFLFLGFRIVLSIL